MVNHTTDTKTNQSAWNDNPDHQINIEPCAQRLRVVYNGEAIADSERALLVREQDHAPVYYFPQQDVRMDVLSPTTKVTFCPYKGNAAHWALNLGEQYVEVAAWSYAEPFEQVKIIRDYIAFYPGVIEQLS